MMYGFCGRSELGPRKSNQDTFGGISILTGEGRLAAAIADGVGGRRAGHVASSIAVDDYLLALSEGDGEPLDAILRRINEHLLQRQEEESGLHGMSTTLTGVLVSGRKLLGVHCGDSRAVLLRNNGIKRLTEDHTEVMRLLKAGLLTKEQAAEYPRKNVIESALGAYEAPRVDTFEYDLLERDRVLLTTDGVHNKVFLKEIRDLSVSNASLEGFLEALLETVHNRGPEDNYTCVCVEVR